MPTLKEIHQKTQARIFFEIAKAHIERRLDANGWRWSSRDSLLLGCLLNMEADYE